MLKQVTYEFPSPVFSTTRGAVRLTHFCQPEGCTVSSLCCNVHFSRESLKHFQSVYCAFGAPPLPIPFSHRLLIAELTSY